VTPPRPEDYLEFAIDAAHAAGRLTLGYFQAGVQPDMKPDDTPVTVADRKAEQLIRGRIERRFPDHRIVGEEFGRKEGDPSAPCWWIDPIDGTKAFVRGVPLYAVLLGLEADGHIVAGAAYFPALDEMVCAAEGTGCFWNGRRCRVSEVDRLSRAVVSFTNAGNFKAARRETVWRRAVDQAYHTVGWSDAYGHALVATGRVELMLDPLMNPHDCGPFPVILREAGGYFGDWSGTETIHAGEALSTSRRLLPDVLRLVAGRDEP
jgi:myo-inositol-1(or 4)-monophosphatase